MLSLNVKDGEYITIGDDIVVQTYRFGAQTQVLVDAPREIPILRGKVRERDGDAAPGSVIKGSRRQPTPSDLRHAEARQEVMARRQKNRDGARAALSEINAMLNTLGDTPEGAWLRERVERIAPVVE